MTAGIWHSVTGLVAKKGAPAPDPVDALFDKFLELALPGEGGPVFLAKLKGKKPPGAKANTGIWAQDLAGDVHKVVRTGDDLPVDTGTKRVSILQFLPVVLGVPGQGRGFNEDGFLTFRAIFTDGTEGVYKVIR